VHDAAVSFNPPVVIGGPANTYAHYIATTVKYGVQRNEGASTLDADIHLTLQSLQYLASDTTT
jgi:neutral ceramidase